MSPAASAPKISRELATALRAHHVAFLRERLVSEVAERDWSANLGPIVEALLEAKVGAVVSAESLSNALEKTLTRESVRKVVAPLARATLELSLRELSTFERAKLARFLPLGGVDKLQRLLELPNLVPERAVREIVEHPAMEEVMRDVLESAFVEFDAKVNPLQIAKKLIPFGALATGLDTIRGELERRIEPERKKFLLAFSRRAMKMTADAVLARRDAPAFLELRKHLAAAVLDLELSALARDADPAALRLANELGVEIASQVFEDAGVRARRAEIVRRVLDPVRDLSVREALATVGVDASIDLGPLARASWPLVRALLASAPVLAWLDAIAGEMYEGLIDDAG